MLQGPRIRAGSASYRPIHLATGSTSLPSQPRIHGQPISNTGPDHHSLSAQTSPRHGVFSSSNTNQDQDNHQASSPAKAPLAQSLPSAESPQQPQPIVQPQPNTTQFNGLFSRSALTLVPSLCRLVVLNS
uniref:Uncharacterized protein n=1 Tax=Ditylenchus dipsaci TaxID=166011 RepID=A0A915EI57_9BILA